MFSDKTLETSTTTGTGTFNLAGAPSGYRTFVTGIGSGSIAFYIAQDRTDSTIWEVGYGTVTDASPDTLTRNLLASSTGSLINFAAGTRDIWSYGIGAALASIVKGNAVATGRPGWLPSGAMWIDTSATPWVLYVFDGTDNIQIATINATTNVLTLKGITDLLASANVWTADPTFRSTDAGATAAPVVTLDRNSASPAVSDVMGALDFNGRDSGGNAVTYARIIASIVDPTNGSEDGRLQIRVVRAGSEVDVLLIGEGGVQIGSPTGADKGAGTLNAAGVIYQNNRPVMQIVQVVNTQTGAVATTTTVVPNDDTIPQNTEGAEFMTLAITPTSATNKLLIEVVLNARTANDNGVGVALFQDTTADALAAVQQADFDADVGSYPISFKHYMTAGTTSATTFKVRAGPLTAGTVTVNGLAGARKFGGVMASSITITEITA